MMKLWTIQPVEVMDIINTTGIFRCDEDKSDNFKDFHDAYLWLVKQMDARNIKHPSGVELPLWAWHTRNWEHKKPDLRNIGYGIPGEQYVCIEFEIDDKEVLLSDYNTWHYVLNCSWFDDSTNEKEFNEKHEWFDKLPPKKKAELREKSWQKIFNVEPNHTDWNKNGEYIQATFWELRKDMITNVRYFKAR